MLSVLQLLFFVLQGIQLIVAALLVQQLLMAALLQNLSVGQEDDVVRVLDGTQAVGNDELPVLLKSLVFKRRKLNLC